MSDLGRLFRRYRWLCLATLLIGAVAAIVVGLLKSTSYTATASIRVQDITELEGFSGSSVSPTDGAPQIASGVVLMATSDPVLRQTLAALGSKEKVSDLRSEVSASVDATSDLVDLSASESSAVHA